MFNFGYLSVSAGVAAAAGQRLNITVLPGNVGQYKSFQGNCCRALHEFHYRFAVTLQCSAKEENRGLQYFSTITSANNVFYGLGRIYNNVWQTIPSLIGSSVFHRRPALIFGQIQLCSRMFLSTYVQIQDGWRCKPPNGRSAINWINSTTACQNCSEKLFNLDLSQLLL